MSVRDEAGLVAGWWEYWRRFEGTRQERKDLSLGEPVSVVRAADLVHDIMDGGGQPAVDLLVALIVGADTADDLITVGVGPLEDLMTSHGDDVVDEIERLARTSPRFRAALCAANLPDRFDARLRPLC